LNVADKKNEKEREDPTTRIGISNQKAKQEAIG